MVKILLHRQMRIVNADFQLWFKLEGTSLPDASLASLNNDADTYLLSFQTEQERGA